MRKFAYVMIVCLAAASMGANLFITEMQNLIRLALVELKFEPVKKKLRGGQRFKVTKDTLKRLKEIMDNGDVIDVDAEGVVTVIEAKKDI